MVGRVILIGWGSNGDVFPMIGIGRLLLQRGHHVTLITNEHFQPPIERAGLTFRELGSAQMYRDTLNNAEIWHPRKGFKAVAALSQQFLEPMFDLTNQLLDEAGDVPTVVAGTTLALGARVAREVRDFALASVHLQPAVMLSLDEPPVLMSGLPHLRSLPRWMRRAFYALMHRQIDAVMGPAVNDFRLTLGLPPVKRMYDRWWHSPDAIIGLWPQWYAPPAADWPPNVHLTGFARYDDRAGSLDDEIENYLNSGEKPLVFTPGSANRHAHRFFDAAIEACIRLKRRGILLTQFREHLPSSLPPHVKHFSYAPLRTLLPRCAAVSHHAGVGTTAAALAAGIPQVLMPMAHDQPDNATRAARLGVAAVLPPHRYTGRAVAGHLATMLDDRRMAERCTAIADRLSREDGCLAAADRLEAMMRPAGKGK